MTEQLTISRLGHRGDGVADTHDGPVYVPYVLPGETVTVEPVAGHPDRRHLDPCRQGEPRTHRADLQAFRANAAAAPCSTGRWPNIILETRAGGRSARACRSDRAGRAADRRPWPRPPPRGAACAARRPRLAGSRLHGAARASHRRHRPLSDPRAPGLDGAIAAAWAIAEILKPADKPLDIQVTATDSGMDVDVRGSGPLDPGAPRRSPASPRSTSSPV